KDRRPLTIALALITTLVSCGAQDPPAPRVSDPQSVGGQGPGGEPPVMTGQMSNAGGEMSNLAGATSGTASTSTHPPSGGNASCPTYDDDFLPKVYTPICSTCHSATSQVPNWGVYSTAKASCAAIGSRVASATMPPPRSGLSLSADQKSLVADWVRL